MRTLGTDRRSTSVIRPMWARGSASRPSSRSLSKDGLSPRCRPDRTPPRLARRVPSAHDRAPDRYPADRSRCAAVQRHPGAARGRERVPGLLLGPFRRRSDAVRERPVHDHRGHGRRQDRAASLLGRLGAGGRGLGRLRVLRAARRGRDVHAAAVAPAGRSRACG